MKLQKLLKLGKKLIPKPEVKVNPDAERINRELNYSNRLDKVDPRMAKLDERIKNQVRRSYGK